MRLAATLVAFPLFALAFAGCSAPAAEGTDELASNAQAWDTQSVTDEAQSTHLWIVDRAVDILAGRSEAASKKAVRLLQNATCATNWRQGLYDADFLDA